MYIYIFVVIIFILRTSHGQTPQSVCIPPISFGTKNNICANFNNICVKKEDLECDNFLSACHQCPATNETILRWHEFATVSHELVGIIKLYKEQSNKTTRKLEDDLIISKANMDSLTRSFKRLKATAIALLIIIIILLILVMVLMVVELRFKLITKKYERKTGKDNKHSYRLLKIKKYSETNINNDPYQMMSQIIDQKLKDFKPSDVKIKSNYVNDITTRHISFDITEMGKILKIPVHDDDNTIKVKRILCAKLDSVPPYYYKMMKLKYNDVILDDNEYLISSVPSLNGHIVGYFDKAINSRNVMVVKIEGNRRLPEYLQIQITQTIREIKTVISQFCTGTFSIYKDHKGSKELKDESTALDCDLKDDETIRAITIEQGSLRVTYIFEDEEEMVIKYTNTDTVANLKNRIALNVEKTTEQFFLFHNCDYMEDNFLLFDVDIRDQDEIKYVSLTSLENLDIVSFVTPGEISEIFQCINKTSKKEIMVKKYTFESSENLRRNKGLLKELSKYQKMKTHSIFVKLHGLNIKDNILQVSMEYIKGKSMKDIVDISFPIPEKDISRWTKEILEGLQHLHKENEIYRYLKSTNILKDKLDKIRLSSFGLSKYIHGIDSQEMSTGLSYNSISKFIFIAPEVLNSKPFTKSTDVWLFGENLLKLVTGKGAYSNKPLIGAMNDINCYQDVEYEQPKQGISEQLKSFLDRSLIADPIERPTVDQLLDDSFLKTSN